ncbi:hypothetical protein [Qipengyuania sp.]|uniref:hypothetical protein n=1 Tax=Qipengyuania sp. TaxID=2004515 RepID=UPI0035C7F8C7
MTEILLASLLILAASSPETSTPAYAEAHLEGQPKLESVKCKSVKQLGSRIPERVCRTVGEWMQIEKENAEVVEEQRRQRMSGPGVNPD